MFPFLRPLGALRLWKREVIEFFNSVLNSAIKIRQEGKEVSISNSFSIYSTSSLTTKTISINSVRANGHVVNDIHLMWLPHYLAERLVNILAFLMSLEQQEESGFHLMTFHKGLAMTCIWRILLTISFCMSQHASRYMARLHVLVLLSIITEPRFTWQLCMFLSLTSP